MKTARILQKKYNDIYANFRNYIWDISAVEAIADLEVETYRTFPDVPHIDKKLQTLKRIVTSSEIYKEDEDFQEAFAEFEEALSDTDSIYAELKIFKEVIPV